MAETHDPWSAGILWNRDGRLAIPMIRHLQAQGLCVGDNEPYSGRNGGFSVEYHAGDAGLPHVSIEVRQDLVTSPPDAERWAVRLAGALTEALDGTDCLKGAPG